MSGTVPVQVPDAATAVRLCRVVREELLACEAVLFPAGARAVDTILRRAGISGRVEIGGEIADHFADLLDVNGDMVETVALDAGSYRALKTRWMPTRVRR